MKVLSVILFGVIVYVTSVWSLATKRPGEFEQFRYEYCIANFCDPFEDCYMYTFCRFALMHQKQLADKEMGTLTDYEKDKNMRLPLFNKTVKVLPSDAFG